MNKKKKVVWKLKNEHINNIINYINLIKYYTNLIFNMLKMFCMIKKRIFIKSCHFFLHSIKDKYKLFYF